MTEAVSAMLMICYAVFGWWLWRKSNPQPEQKPEEQLDDDEEDIPDFEFLSVREQIDTVKRTSDKLAALEDLQLQLQESTEDDILPVQMEWLSRDGTTHQLTVFGDGQDLITECLITLTEVEIHDTRKVLAYQCETLAKRSRSRKNRRKNSSDTEGEYLKRMLEELRGSAFDGEN